MLNPLRNPGGTTVLVTGERGAGKTSLVNAALFHASLLARFEDGWLTPPEATEARTGSLLTSDTWDHWAKTEWFATNTPPEVSRWKLNWMRNIDEQDLVAERKKLLEQQAKLQQQRSTRLKGFEAVVLLDVHVPFPESFLTHRQILSRTLRRLYFRLVSAGLADANPQFVRNARLAYLRSVASSFKETSSEKYVASFESGLQKGELGFAAKQELELSWELAIELERSDTSELGDDIQLLLEDLARLRLGGEGLLKRASRALTGMFTTAKDFFQGTEQLRIHPVIIFDEIDKALPPIKGEHPKQDGPDSPDKTSYLARAVGALKTVLTAHGATFVFIAGSEHAQRWSSSTHDSRDAEMLRSVFPDRFHVRRLSLAKIDALLSEYCLGLEHLPADHPCRAAAVRVAQIEPEILSRALRYVSGGLMRSVARLLREAQLKNRATADDRRCFHRIHLAEVLTGLDAKKAGSAPRFENNLRALAQSDAVVDKAHLQLVEEVAALELPSAATRVAGKGYALADAMWGAASRTLEALRRVDRVHDPKAGDFPAARLLNELTTDTELIEWCEWFKGLRTTEPTKTLAWLPFRAMPTVLEAVVDALPSNKQAVDPSKNASPAAAGSEPPTRLIETDVDVIRRAVEELHRESVAPVDLRQ